MKYLNNTQKNRILKENNSPLESEKDFKPINVSTDDVGKFEEKEIAQNKRKRLQKILGTIDTIG